MLSSKRTKLLVGGLVSILLLAGVSLARARTEESGSPAFVRQAPTSTPSGLIIPSDTPTPTPTETPTRTPTISVETIKVEAISENTNVRSGPDINDSVVAQINPGIEFTVLGQHYNWYQIEFPDTATGFAWVYFEVVNVVSGDPDLIPQLELADLPTPDPIILAEQQTAEFIEQTPGAQETLNAVRDLTLTAVATPEEALATAPPPGFVYPTFTPIMASPTPIAIPKTSPALTESEDEGLPPIVPILALGALGIMGLLVGFLRRL
ncbi:MAG: SH3 domain-containing protein [Chloroflexi bacterium]|nr:SH3 domain-containing protein [Chloroflexota bacterium]